MKLYTLVSQYKTVIKEMESEAEIIKLEEKRLAERRRAIEKKVISLETYLQDQLESLGIDKIKSPLITITIRNNPPSVHITNDLLIPAKYLIPQEPKIAIKEISKALKNGEVIEGVELVRKRGLQIK